MRKRSIVPDDVTLVRAIEASASFEEAARRLGLGKTTVRTHADRLGVRTRFRYGVEKLPADRMLKALLRDAGKASGLLPLARRLGVTQALLEEEAERLGVDPRLVIRAGLPDDKTLRVEILTCERLSDVARRYGVHDHTIRNQAKRLGITAPSKRAVFGRENDDAAPPA